MGLVQFFTTLCPAQRCMLQATGACCMLKAVEARQSSGCQGVMM